MMNHQKRFAFVALGIALGLAAPASLRAADEPRTVKAGDLSFEVPKTWTSERPSNAMRKAQIKLPAADGEKDQPELVVTSFSGGAGSVDANVKRWESQFTDEKGGTPKAKVEEKKGKNVDVTRVEVSGRFVAAMMPGQAAKNDKPDYKLLGAIVATPDASYYFKLTGPEKAVTKASKDFDALIKSMSKPD